MSESGALETLVSVSAQIHRVFGWFLLKLISRDSLLCAEQSRVIRRSRLSIPFLSIISSVQKNKRQANVSHSSVPFSQMIRIKKRHSNFRSGYVRTESVLLRLRLLHPVISQIIVRSAPVSQRTHCVLWCRCQLCDVFSRTACSIIFQDVGSIMNIYERSEEAPADGPIHSAKCFKSPFCSVRSPLFYRQVSESLPR